MRTTNADYLRRTRGSYVVRSIAWAFVGLLLCALLASASGAAAAADLDAKVQFDIPSHTPLDKALIEWGRRTGLQVMIATDTVAQKTTEGVRGLLSARAALTALLKDSGLSYAVEGNTVTVRLASDQRRGSDEQTASPHFPYQSSDSGSSGDADKRLAPPERPLATQKPLDEVVVTGSHIGAIDPVSPVKVYTRAEIDQTGLGTVAAFIQSLPQNFNGGKADATVGDLTGGVGVNATNGTAVNLRGVGSNSSLVLINGRRLSAADLDGDFIDISMIPLAALERVEVVTDGASAIYGSDAVGGVVNFIMRRDFEGAETRLRYGSVSDGSHHETQAAQTFGHAWDGGSALVSYEYQDSTPLNASDRSYTQVSRADGPFTLLSQQTRQGIFASAEQDIGNSMKLFADGLYGNRDTFSDFTADGLSQHSPASAAALSASVGLRAELLPDSTLELSSTYGSNSTHARVLDLTSAEAPISDLTTDTGLWSVDGKLDGRLWALPAGRLRYALGAQFRRESIDAQDELGDTRFVRSRNVSALYLELRIPLIGSDTEPSAHRLELSMAGRSEHYSDFGGTSNPQLGIVWRPWEGLKLRGTYGTSFKAPVLSSLNPHLDTILPLPEPDPLAGGTTNVLVLFGGGNPALKPEKARTWTAGLDWRSEATSGLRSSLSYYGIRYTNRIASAADSIGLFDLLQDEAVLGSAVVQRGVPGAQIAALTQNPAFQNPFAINTATISTIANFTIPENLSVVTTSGIDVDVAYSRLIGTAQTEVGVAATRILRFNNQFTAASPAISVLDTVFNPADLRARVRWTTQIGALSTAIFLNYTNSYTDSRSGAPVPVSSWTTVDLSAAYAFQSSAEPLHDVSISLSFINVANRDPPHIVGNANTRDIINYDGANANPLGRFVSLQVAKQW